MPVKHDKRVITHATPPLVTLRRHKSGKGELQLHCKLSLCDHEDTLTDGDETITIECGGWATISRTVDGLIERVCDQHYEDFRKQPTLEMLIAELDELLMFDENGKRDMTTFHGHGQDYTTTTMPDDLPRIKRDENGMIVW